VTAATACKGKNIFMLLGGIGFDQIPAVRNWAERNRMLYMHHTATVKGSKGQRFSFAPLPTVERTARPSASCTLEVQGQEGRHHQARRRELGAGRGRLQGLPGPQRRRQGRRRGRRAAEQGQLHRRHPEDEERRRRGRLDLGERLGATQIVKQIKAQNYKPNMMLFPFNLTAQTLDADAFKPALDGVAMFTAYSKGDYAGSFASYADDIRLFEAQYRSTARASTCGWRRPAVPELDGAEGAVRPAARLRQDCNRNRFVERPRATEKPTSSAARDFTAGNPPGSDQLCSWRPTGSAGQGNWRNTRAASGAADGPGPRPRLISGASTRCSRSASCSCTAAPAC
jgi:hypothetical protein